MKRSRFKSFFIFSILIAALFLTPAYAHPGRTDADGGHYDRSTGEYHYHHGYPAHQHPNGICPYEDEEPETTRAASSTHKQTSSTKVSSAPVSPKPANSAPSRSASERQLAVDIMNLAYTGFMYMLIPVMSLLIKRRYNLFEIICISFLSALFGWGYFWWDAWSRGGSSSVFAALAWGLVDFFFLMKVAYSDE